MTHYLRNTLLRDGDQMSMANSMELRAPFVDSDLVELVASTPPSMRVRANRQKPLLVNAVGLGLPAEIVKRVKHSFNLPFNSWLRNGLKVAPPSAGDLGLDSRALDAVTSRFHRGQDWPRYWSLQVLSAWAERNRLSPPSRERE
jgi:asparagine synthase (glutamine-hydrolysing)